MINSFKAIIEDIKVFIIFAIFFPIIICVFFIIAIICILFDLYIKIIDGFKKEV
tara:strand:+ start:582 stop:743 length:162 start_codon:yes stop_codon:yes gene_type:complete